MATTTELTRARESVDELCRTATDETQLRVEVLAALRSAVGFDAHIWLMTDPGSCVGSAPLADIPSPPSLPATMRLKYLTQVNRWTRLLVDRQSVASLLDSTDGDRSQSLLWRDMQSHHDIGDVASSVYADRFGCWGFLDLWRKKASGPFSTDECQFLRSIAVPITTALRACVAAKFVTPVAASSHGHGPVVLILDESLSVVSQTVASQDWLDALLPAPPSRSPVPASVYNAAAQLLAREQRVDNHLPTARVHLDQGFWVTVRAARLDPARSQETPRIAVTIEESSPSERLDLYARARGLSSRESELLSRLATSADTRAIAAQMSVPEHTLQDHLTAIFAKTGAGDRASLLRRALGVREA